MKKISLFISICASLILFVNASVWEGAASVSSGAELPESGLYIATNSFPANTIVDVTNLENGRTTRVIASSGLETPGLLALLSRDAASAIGLQSRSLGRMRMSQPADPVAFSRFTEGLTSSGDPDYDPAAFVALNGILPDEPEAEIETGNKRVENGDLIVDLPDSEEIEEPALAAEPEAPIVAQIIPEDLESPSAPESKPEELTPFVPLAIVDDTIVPDNGPVAAEARDFSALPEQAPVPFVEPDYDLSLAPADTRLPEEGPGPEISRVIPGIPEAPLSPAPEPVNPDYIDPSLIIDPIREAPALTQTVPAERPPELSQMVEPAMPALQQMFEPAMPSVQQIAEPVMPPPQYIIEPVMPAQAHIFSAPLISSLEKGKYYLQIAAYSKAETVQSEISKISGSYPMAIMNAGSSEKPIYRVLIGPVNLGESGALLQRFKVSHKDAFIRLGT